MEHEQEYTGLLLGTDGWRQQLAPILCSAPDKSFASLAAACHRHLAARALALVARPDALAAQPSLYILHTKSAQPLPGVAQLSDPQLVPPGLDNLDLGAFTWDWGSISTGSPTFLPKDADPPIIATCGSVKASLQLQLGVLAEFSYWRAYLLQEQSVGVAITGITSSGSNGRRNLTLNLAAHHKANGARRLFRLEGFSQQCASLNGLWKSDTVIPQPKKRVKGNQQPADEQQPSGGQQYSIKFSAVPRAVAAAAEQALLGPGHRVAAVYNLMEQEWLDHLTLKRVVDEGGRELSQQELSALMGEVFGGPVVPAAAPADGAQAAPAAGGPAVAPAPAGAALLEQQVQLQQLRLESVGAQQHGLARLADTHSRLHQESHTRLCWLEASREQQGKRLDQHDATLASHSSQLTDIKVEYAAIWERLQADSPARVGCGEGEPGAGQPSDALPGRKRARQEGGVQQAAAALVSQPAMGSAAGGGAAMEQDDLAEPDWFDWLTRHGSPMPAATGPAVGHGMPDSAFGASSGQASRPDLWEGLASSPGLPDVPATDSLASLAALPLPTLPIVLQQPVVELPASPMPDAASGGAVATAPGAAGALMPSAQRQAAQETEWLLASMSLDPLAPAPVPRLPSREDIKHFLAIHCLSALEARTTAHLVAAVGQAAVQQAAVQVESVQAGMQLFQEVQAALVELCQQGSVTCEAAPSSSALQRVFAWRLAAGQHG